VREDIYELRRNKPLIQNLIANCTPTAKLSQPGELPAIPPTDTAQPEKSGRFTSFCGKNSLEDAGKWCGLGPKAAAAQLVAELEKVSSLPGDRRQITSPVNLAKARAVALALAKLTPEERSGKARAAALARYSKPQKAHGSTGNTGA
jgi:hypothetical protein